jgi:hypothetical protein
VLCCTLCRAFKCCVRPMPATICHQFVVTQWQHWCPLGRCVTALVHTGHLRCCCAILFSTLTGMLSRSTQVMIVMCMQSRVMVSQHCPNLPLLHPVTTCYNCVTPLQLLVPTGNAAHSMSA